LLDDLYDRRPGLDVEPIEGARRKQLFPESLGIFDRVVLGPKKDVVRVVDAPSDAVSFLAICLRPTGSLSKTGFNSSQSASKFMSTYTVMAAPLF